MKKCIDVFTYDQLNEKAQAAARDWYRNATAGESLDHEFIFNDVEAIAPLMGLEMGTRDIPLMNGKTRRELDIAYSVGFVQGDYARFSATWSAESFPRTKRGRPRACPVKDHAPRDMELRRICRALSGIAAHFPGMVARISQHHYYGMQLECESPESDTARQCGFENWEKLFNETEKQIKELMRDFAQWIYKQLRDEILYQSSDEVVAETIRANEYLFTRDGARSVVL